MVGQPSRLYPQTAAAVEIMEKIMSFMFLVPSSMLSAVSALSAQLVFDYSYENSGSISRIENVSKQFVSNGAGHSGGFVDFYCNMCYGICKREKSIWKNGGLNENFRIIFYLP